MALQSCYWLSCLSSFSVTLKLSPVHTKPQMWHLWYTRFWKVYHSQKPPNRWCVPKTFLLIQSSIDLTFNPLVWVDHSYSWIKSSIHLLFEPLICPCINWSAHSLFNLMLSILSYFCQCNMAFSINKLFSRSLLCHWSF